MNTIIVLAIIALVFVVGSAIDDYLSKNNRKQKRKSKREREISHWFPFAKN